MEKSGGAESAPTYQMVNLNISNITVQAHKAGLSFLGARLTEYLVTFLGGKWCECACVFGKCQ